MAQAGKPAVPAGTLTGTALVLGAASLWATFGLFAKYLYDAGFQPLELASIRVVVAFIVLLLYATLRGLRSVRVPFRALPFLAAYGLLGFTLFELIFFLALQRTSVSIGVALLYSAPAFVVIISASRARERIEQLHAIALLLILTGVVLVSGAASAVLLGGAPLPAPAVALGLASGLGYAVYTLMSKTAAERHGAFPALFWCFAFGALAMALVAPPLAPLLREPAHVPVLVALGIIPTVLPYALYLRALRTLRASTAAMLTAIEPVVAGLLAMILLGERLGGLQWLGILLVVTAASLLTRETSTSTSTH